MLGVSARAQQPVALAAYRLVFLSARMASDTLDDDVDRHQVIDYVAAELWIALIRLDVSVSGGGARQQRVAPRRSRRQPVKGPATPCIGPSRVEQGRGRPGLAAVGAHAYLGDCCLTRPRNTHDAVSLVRSQDLGGTWSNDLGLQFHRTQRLPNCPAIRPVPVRIVGSLPVPLEWSPDGFDVGQPLHGSHSVVAGNDCPHRIAVLER